MSQFGISAVLLYSLSSTDLRYCAVATQQQSCQSSATGGRPDIPHIGRHVGLPGRKTYGASWRCAVRIPRRRIPGGSGFDSRGTQSNRECDR